ncbi:MAG: hypothetical protein V3U07_01650, partial [Nitrospirales bacterium]
ASFAPAVKVENPIPFNLILEKNPGVLPLIAPQFPTQFSTEDNRFCPMWLCQFVRFANIDILRASPQRYIGQKTHRFSSEELTIWQKFQLGIRERSPKYLLPILEETLNASYNS